MATETRRYLIARKDGTAKPRLVKAPNEARAVAHVADSMLMARVATQEDLERLLPLGVKVERIHEAPAPTAQD